MNGKSTGSGLLNDKGEIVREIKAQELFKKIKQEFRELLIKKLDSTGTKPDMVIIDEFANYQNDGIGCPGEYKVGFDKTFLVVDGVGREVVTESKATKLKRVK